MPRQTLRFPLSVPADSEARVAAMTRIENRLRHRAAYPAFNPLGAGDTARAIHAVRVFSDPARADHAGHHHAVIELDYDPALISLAQINAWLGNCGAGLTDSTRHAVLPVSGLVSSRHELAVESALNRLPGVTATVSYPTQHIRVEFDTRHSTLPDILRRLDGLGVHLRKGAFTALAAMPAEVAPPTPEERERARVQEMPLVPRFGSVLGRGDVLTAIGAGVTLLAAFLIHQCDGPRALRLFLVATSFVLGGFFPARELLAAIRAFRPNIDLLMFAAAFGAAALGNYEEGALLLFLFTLGGTGERLALDRARNALHALSQLTPQTGTLLLADGSTREVAVEALRVGDAVLVAPGQLVPADGTVSRGESSVNQATITGESAPVSKAPGDTVFAGTINGEGLLHVRVDKLASDNTLSRIIRLVEEAQSTRSPTQVFTDRVARWYVPLVLISTAALMVLPPLIGIAPRQMGHDLWRGWFYQAMAFLTAASPCALAIGTPAATLAGIAAAARLGVLIKGGVHLENLGKVRAIAFDKTGTLTLGRPRVTDIRVVGSDGSITAEKALQLAASVEAQSRHPIAMAVVAAAGERGLAPLPAQGVQQVAGKGITGVVVEGATQRTVSIGKLSMHAPTLADFPAAAATAAELESRGRTLLVLADAHRVLAVFGAADEVRPGAAEMLVALKSQGIERCVMLTGDHARSAAAIASSLPLDQIQADLLPEEKLTRIQQMRDEFGTVAMVGDGVNDAPALAAATVGIAMAAVNAAGKPGASDTAIETADVAVLSDDMRRIPQAVATSRFTRRVVQQNLVIALGTIAVLAPLAGFGAAPIAVAVLFHEGSTVLVVLNALRILRFRAA